MRAAARSPSRWSPPTPPPARSGSASRSTRIARGAQPRDTILVSAGSDGVPTTANRAALLALLAPLRDRRDIVLVDARGTGRSGRVGDRLDAYGAGAAAADLDAVRSELGAGHVELYARRRRRAHRARLRRTLRRPRARARARRRAARGAPRRRRPRRGARARQGARAGEPHRRDAWRRACARGRCASTAASTTTSLARAPCARDARSLAELPAAATAALKGDRRAARAARRAMPRRRPAGRPRRRARATATTTPRPRRAPAVDGGPFTAATWLRALGPRGVQGLAAAGDAGSRRCRPDAALSGAPALVLAGELGVAAPTRHAAQGRRAAPVGHATCACAARPRCPR